MDSENNLIVKWSFAIGALLVLIAKFHG